jgi:hypothetical protein
MATLAMILAVIGYIISLVGGIWLLVVAFQEGIGWGLACLLLPFVSIVFVILHWEDAKSPFLTSLAGGVALILASVLKGM